MGLSADEPVWHPTVFTKNRDRLLEGAVAEEFFTLVLEQARRKRLLSSEHFTVDGTLIEAWAGQKSFQPKPGWDDHLKPPPPSDPGSNPTIDFRKQKRSNETHQSLTDRFARLFKKGCGSEAKLGYLGHVVTENRNGLVVDVRLTQATGTAERDAALEMRRAKAGNRCITLGVLMCFLRSTPVFLVINVPPSNEDINVINARVAVSALATAADITLLDIEIVSLSAE